MSNTIDQAAVQRAAIAISAIDSLYGVDAALQFAVILAQGGTSEQAKEAQPKSSVVELTVEESWPEEPEPAKEERQGSDGALDGFRVRYSGVSRPAHRWSVRPGDVLRRVKTGQDFVVLQVGDDNPRRDICALLSNTYKDYKGEVTAGLNLTRSNNAWLVVGEAIGDEVPS
jgi:hypothetical protein